MTARIEAFYDRDPGYEWDREMRHRTEFAVTRRALQTYLPGSPLCILDVGGGPGRYTLWLAEQGHRLTLFDLSRNLLALGRQHAALRHVDLEASIHGTATDLSEFAAGSFDAVLLMGPLYHLLEAADRAQAVQEAQRVLKPGGLIFAAFITRYASLRSTAKLDPAALLTQAESYQRILRDGVYEAQAEPGFTSAYFAHPTEVEPLMTAGGFEKLNLIACEGIVSLIEDQINTLEGALWEAWVDLNYQLGQDPSLFGGAEHLLYVGRKPQPAS